MSRRNEGLGGLWWLRVNLAGLTAVGILVAVQLAFGQSGKGGIVGTVRDQSGAVVPAASVVARDVATGVETRTVTTGSGDYTIPDLDVGIYSLTITHAGFQTYVRTDIRIILGVTLTIDARLPVGGVTQTVTVTGVATAIDKTSTTTGNTQTSESVAFLPIQVSTSAVGGRDSLNFVRLEPGVAYSNGASVIQGDGDESGFGTIAGVKIDGVSQAVQPNHAQTIADVPNPDVIQEFRVVTNANADSGWDMGSTIELISKSGTNQFHGSAYDYLRNNVLDSRNFFSKTVSPEKMNDFGGTLGGPILKDKLFFLANYEGFRYRTTTTSTTASVPTAAMLNGDFSALLGSQAGTDALGRPVYLNEIYDPTTTRQLAGGTFIRDPYMCAGALNVICPGAFSSISRFFQAGLPAPTSAAISNNWIGQGLPTLLSSDRIYAKIDYTHNSHKLSFTYDNAVRALSYAGACIFSATIAACSPQNLPQRRVRFIYTWTLSPNLLLSLSGGINEDEGGVNQLVPDETYGAQAGLTGVATPNAPAVGIQSYTGFGGNGLNHRTNHSVPATASLTWVKGKHDFKYGSDFYAGWTPQYITNGSSGTFNFNRLETGQPGFNTTTGWGYASYLVGVVDSASMSTPKSVRYANQAWGFYAQDQWRVTSKLTVNYGLRYDIFQAPLETHDRIGAFSPTVVNPSAGGLLGALTFWGDGPGRNGLHRVYNTYYGGLGPRIGLAYQVNSTTVVRAYFGAQRYPLNVFLNGGINFAGANLGWGVSLSSNSQNSGVTPAFNWQGGFPVAIPNLPNLNPALVNGSSVSYANPQDDKAGLGENMGLGFEHQFHAGYILSVDYVGKRVHNIPNSTLVNLNQLSPQNLSFGSLLLSSATSTAAQSAGIHIPYAGFSGSVAQALLPYPQYAQAGIAEVNSMSANTLYDAFEVGIRKDFYRGLTLFANYTLSKDLTTANETPQYTGAGYRNTAKALAGFDQPQVAKVAYTYQLPFGRGQKFLSSPNPILEQVIGGWVAAGILTYASGTPVAVASEQTLPGIGPAWAVETPGAGLKTGLTCGTFIPHNGLYDHYLNINAFQTPAPYTFGNVFTLPNFRGCGVPNEDMSFAKQFPVHENVKLEFGGDFFNIFNRHAWTGLQTDINNASTFGQFTGATGPRSMQFHLKVIF